MILIATAADGAGGGGFRILAKSDGERTCLGCGNRCDGGTRSFLRVALYTYGNVRFVRISWNEAAYTDLCDGAATHWGLIELLEDFIKWSLEDSLYDALRVVHGMHPAARVKRA